MEDAARVCFEPADVLRSIAREHAETRTACGVVSHNGLVFRKIEWVERKGEVHDDCVGTGDSEIVHHLGRADSRYWFVKYVRGKLDAIFASRKRSRSNYRVTYKWWHKGRVI